MLKVHAGAAVAMLAAIGASAALAAGRQGGTIHFMGRIVESGFSVQAASRTAGAKAADGLQTQAAASADQVVVDFRTLAVRPVPAEVSVAARSASSAMPLRVGDARSGADIRVRYDGFQANNLLAGQQGTLTVSRRSGAEPALAVVTIAYR